MGLERINALSDLKKPSTPEPPDCQDVKGEKAATLVPNEIIDPYQLLSKFARKRMRKQVKE